MSSRARDHEAVPAMLTKTVQETAVREGDCSDEIILRCLGLGAAVLCGLWLLRGPSMVRRGTACRSPPRWLAVQVLGCPHVPPARSRPSLDGFVEV